MQDKKSKQNVGFSERTDNCSPTILESIVDPSSELEGLLGPPPDNMFDTPLSDGVETDAHEVERLRIQIWNDIVRLKHLNEHHNCKIIQQSSASLLDYSQEQSRRKKLAQNQEKIMNEMRELAEEGLAQGFIYGIVPYKGKPVSGASNNLLKWWKEIVRFGQNGPAAIREYQTDIDIMNAILKHELNKYFGLQHNAPPPPSMERKSYGETMGDASSISGIVKQPISEAMQEESMNVTQYLAMDVNMFTRRNLPNYELGPQDQPRGSIHQDNLGHIRHSVASASHGNQPLANPYRSYLPMVADNPDLPSGGIEMSHQGTSSSGMNLFQTRLNQDQTLIPEAMKVEIDPLFPSSAQEDAMGTSITRELANLEIDYHVGLPNVCNT
ncbi:hypothetical protein C4D60_Mb06t25150 [Musa balbisiana]|uniref:Ethylene insensitive 3-like DNA-binding domain-containing protein n=1 Tax=Musa balbisiana TaxID=52838 RepID=A0A4S8IT16_MUSBA|nr:hypothetical protein C4D60_Mb06t25150 [Musa balbisiana]